MTVNNNVIDMELPNLIVKPMQRLNRFEPTDIHNLSPVLLQGLEHTSVGAGFRYAINVAH